MSYGIRCVVTKVIPWMKYNGVTLHHYPGPSTLSDQNETKGGKTSLTTSPENF